MKARTWITIAMTLAAVLMTGCRTHRHIASGGDVRTDTVVVQPTPPRQTPRLDTIRNTHFNTYSANFSCTIDGVTVNGQIRIRHDSIIWISLNKVIELGRIIATPSGVEGYVKVMGRYYKGDYAAISKRWGVDIDYATLEALIVGNCVPGCKKSSEPRQNGDTITLWYNQTSGATGKQRQVTLTKNRQNKKLMSCLLTSRELNQQLLLNFKELKNIGGDLLPSTIGVALRCRAANVTTDVNMEKITLNPTLNFPFKIPTRFKEF